MENMISLPFKKVYLFLPFHLLSKVKIKSPTPAGIQFLLLVIFLRNNK